MKFMVAPEGMPDELHWFKWEALHDLDLGLPAARLIFYVSADLNLIDRNKLALAPWQAIGSVWSP